MRVKWIEPSNRAAGWHGNAAHPSIIPQRKGILDKNGRTAQETRPRARPCPHRAPAFRPGDVPTRATRKHPSAIPMRAGSTPWRVPARIVSSLARPLGAGPAAWAARRSRAIAWYPSPVGTCVIPAHPGQGSRSKDISISQWAGVRQSMQGAARNVGGAARVRRRDQRMSSG